MRVLKFQPWLHRFCCATALTTLALIGLGGLVTSHGAGMAVPDWPTTYGYNMFLFPVSSWIGGIFYEHTHRLLASFVGLLTTILAVWIWVKDSRRWLRWAGVAAFFGVGFQGLLGGLRVTLLKDQIGVFHATLAQLFLVLICCIALFTSRWWMSQDWATKSNRFSGDARRVTLALSLLILAQLMIGATMRHQHAGLAVPDFPLAYGKLWPATDAATIERINQTRLDVREFQPVTAFQIYLHMIHRITAVAIVIGVGCHAFSAKRRLGWEHGHTRWAMAWFGLILAQAGLGIMTVLSNKAADVATAHVALGAVSLGLGSLLAVVGFRAQTEAAKAAPGPESSREPWASSRAAAAAR